jgi:hypothetical protein
MRQESVKKTVFFIESSKIYIEIRHLPKPAEKASITGSEKCLISRTKRQ